MNGAHFTFMTSAFVDDEEARALRVNEAVGGHALAGWLAAALRAEGLAAGDPWVEDHGWDFDIRAADRTYLCTCSIEDDEAESRQAHVSVTLSRGAWDRLTGRNRFEVADAVAAAIEGALRRAAEVAGLEKEVVA